MKENHDMTYDYLFLRIYPADNIMQLFLKEVINQSLLTLKPGTHIATL